MNKTFTSLAAGVAMALTFAGCAGGDGIYTDKTDDHGAVIQKKQLVDPQVIVAGQIFSINDGASKITLPANKVGTPQDLPCVLFKDTGTGGYSYGGASCDWDAAYGLRPAPAEKPKP